MKRCCGSSPGQPWMQLGLGVFLGWRGACAGAGTVGGPFSCLLAESSAAAPLLWSCEDVSMASASSPLLFSCLPPGGLLFSCLPSGGLWRLPSGCCDWQDQVCPGSIAAQLEADDLQSYLCKYRRSLVKHRDKLLWERKCCLLPESEEFFSSSSVLFSGHWSWSHDRPHASMSQPASLATPISQKKLQEEALETHHPGFLPSYIALLCISCCSSLWWKGDH